MRCAEYCQRTKDKLFEKKKSLKLKATNLLKSVHEIQIIVIVKTHFIDRVNFEETHLVSKIMLKL